MGLTDDVRAHAAEVAGSPRFVEIDEGRLEGLDPGPAPGLDPQTHYLDGPDEAVAAYILTLDSINFGSGWFPTLRKREGMSGYFTIASALAERFRADGPWSAAELRGTTPAQIARVLGQNPGHELMALYARALRDLGEWLGARTPLTAIRHGAGSGSAAPRARSAAPVSGSAERLAEALAMGMPFFDDRGFWKRAQITANDLALAGLAKFDDLDRLTIFADNLVPHVLRVDGALRYDPGLAARIDAGELLAPGSREEIEIRACAVHACELLATWLGVPARELDVALWNRGQEPRYKAIPRHRARSVYY